ncbi:hypothetical protein EYF80_016077 [Liparis tanakae]|uniref:Uncharacterized protein n=1 Tax=Liparis tanakae TaxID=230148 RepID=A0A4Z2I6N0_9TELE|nr:hypothetical protein EYF80_016077 [Liparis tanakae]
MAQGCLIQMLPLIKNCFKKLQMHNNGFVPTSSQNVMHQPCAMPVPVSTTGNHQTRASVEDTGLA